MASKVQLELKDKKNTTFTDLSYGEFFIPFYHTNEADVLKKVNDGSYINLNDKSVSGYVLENPSCFDVIRIKLVAYKE